MKLRPGTKQIEFESGIDRWAEVVWSPDSHPEAEFGLEEFLLALGYAVDQHNSQSELDTRVDTHLEYMQKFMDEHLKYAKALCDWAFEKSGFPNASSTGRTGWRYKQLGSFEAVFEEKTPERGITYVKDYADWTRLGFERGSLVYWASKLSRAVLFFNIELEKGRSWGVAAYAFEIGQLAERLRRYLTPVQDTGKTVDALAIERETLRQQRKQSQPKAAAARRAQNKAPEEARKVMAVHPAWGITAVSREVGKRLSKDESSVRKSIQHLFPKPSPLAARKKGS